MENGKGQPEDVTKDKGSANVLDNVVEGTGQSGDQGGGGLCLTQDLVE